MTDVKLYCIHTNVIVFVRLKQIFKELLVFVTVAVDFTFVQSYGCGNLCLSPWIEQSAKNGAIGKQFGHAPGTQSLISASKCWFVLQSLSSHCPCVPCNTQTTKNILERFSLSLSCPVKMVLWDEDPLLVGICLTLIGNSSFNYLQKMNLNGLNCYTSTHFRRKSEKVDIRWP